MIQLVVGQKPRGRRSHSIGSRRIADQGVPRLSGRTGEVPGGSGKTPGRIPGRPAAGSDCQFFQTFSHWSLVIADLGVGKISGKGFWESGKASGNRTRRRWYPAMGKSAIGRLPKPLPWQTGVPDAEKKREYRAGPRKLWLIRDACKQVRLRRINVGISPHLFLQSRHKSMRISAGAPVFSVRLVILLLLYREGG